MAKEVRIKATFRESENIGASFKESENLKAKFGDVLMVHTDNYDDLYNKPRINAVTVEGEKTGTDYRLQNKMDILSRQEIEKILYVGGE